MLPGPKLERAFSRCGALQALDAEHSEVPPGAQSRLAAACPALKAQLQEQPQQPPQPPPEQALSPGADSGSSTPDADD
jgi:hypothetical protein